MSDFPLMPSPEPANVSFRYHLGHEQNRITIDLLDVIGYILDTEKLYSGTTSQVLGTLGRQLQAIWDEQNTQNLADLDEARRLLRNSPEKKHAV